jgi:transposase
MPRCLSLTPHLSVDALERRYRACRDPVERSHWQMVWLVAQGQTCPTVARLVGYSERWVRTVIHRYNAAGPAGITDRRHANPGQPPLVPPAVREELRAALAEPPPDGGLWTGPKVATWLSDRLERAISPQRAWETLQRIGFTLHQPRPRAKAADPAAQDAFKKGAA